MSSPRRRTIERSPTPQRQSTSHSGSSKDDEKVTALFERQLPEKLCAPSGGYAYICEIFKQGLSTNTFKIGFSTKRPARRVKSTVQGSECFTLNLLGDENPRFREAYRVEQLAHRILGKWQNKDLSCRCGTGKHPGLKKECFKICHAAADFTLRWLRDWVPTMYDRSGNLFRYWKEKFDHFVCHTRAEETPYTRSLRWKRWVERNSPQASGPRSYPSTPRSEPRSFPSSRTGYGTDDDSMFSDTPSSSTRRAAYSCPLPDRVGSRGRMPSEEYPATPTRPARTRRTPPSHQSYDSVSSDSSDTPSRHDWVEFILLGLAIGMLHIIYCVFAGVDHIACRILWPLALRSKPYLEKWWQRHGHTCYGVWQTFQSRDIRDVIIFFVMVLVLFYGVFSCLASLVKFCV